MRLNMPPESLTPVVRTTLTADIRRKTVSHLILRSLERGRKYIRRAENCAKRWESAAPLCVRLSKHWKSWGLSKPGWVTVPMCANRDNFFSRPLLWAITGSS